MKRKAVNTPAIETATGLPPLPEGLIWRVRSHRYRVGGNYLYVEIVKESKPNGEAVEYAVTDWGGFVTLDLKDQKTAIRRLAERALEDYRRRDLEKDPGEATMNLLGLYPPKSLED